MKKLAVCLAIGLATVVSAVAGTTPEEYVRAYEGRTDVPRPVRVVEPRLSNAYADQEVRVTFTVTELGSVSELKVEACECDRGLTNDLTAAVKQWKFQPVIRDGKAVPTRVILPVALSSRV